MGHSRTAVIDTLQTSGVKASEVRTTTIDFGVTGTFAITLLHRTQSARERVARGGDKVKVLGIRACWDASVITDWFSLYPFYTETQRLVEKVYESGIIVCLSVVSDMKPP